MTNGELQQFKKLLAENNKQLEQNLRQDFQIQLAENNKQIRKEIKAEVDPLHERLDAQREQINNVEKNLAETVRQETGMLADLIVDHDTQIEELQKAVGLRPKH
jgi:hypothetical protein